MTTYYLSDAGAVPEQKLNYINISDLESVEKDAFVDVIGIATSIGEVSSITAKYDYTI